MFWYEPPVSGNSHVNVGIISSVAQKLSAKEAMDKYHPLMSLIILCLAVPSLQVSIATHIMGLSDSIIDRNAMSLVSQNAIFEFGFFSPGNSKSRYLGIWYKNIPIQTVVWVANRLNPLNDSSGILTINRTGSLILAQNGSVLWHTNPLKKPQITNPVVLQLLDSGNLVVREEKEANPENYLWQSFDYPTDTMLPGMKVGWDFRTGLNRRLTAWKSPDDPSPGDLSTVVVLHNYPEYYMMKGTKKYFRPGPWNGLDLSGVPAMRSSPQFNFMFVENKDEVYHTYTLVDNSLITRVLVNQTSNAHERYVWEESEMKWNTYRSMPSDDCDKYGTCGANGNCIITEFPICQCLKGFKPKSPETWSSMEWSHGCVHEKPLNCTDGSKDGFISFEGIKLPDTTHTWVNDTIGLDECRQICLKNCSCMAYANRDIRGAGSGCVMWFGDLIDIKQFSSGGQNLYIRMAASELGVQRKQRKLTIIVATTISATIGMLLLGCFFIFKVSRNMFGKSKKFGDPSNLESISDQDLPLLDLSTIVTATDNFATRNKIGEGGFGPVYKGRLQSGQEIAVKKLSRSSGQGINEFKNEVKLIARVQHRNLVKLIGCCIERQEKILIYEYLTNSSLDSFIFDKAKGRLLDWSKRFHIICGITRGLSYMHHDSRLRIVHRDLKASNVLLDNKFNPKISDFGMAKTFRGDQVEGNTNRVVGTYGYMAPEYAANGLFSIKSDVFSFGILLLEIICGKRNRGFYYGDGALNLIGHAWILWKQGKAMELIDENLKESCSLSEVMRCIHISLLCAQQYSKDRPTMPSVLHMLESVNNLPEPEQPGFFLRKDLVEAYFSIEELFPSINELSITSFGGR